ncbi:MAG: TonB-dependent receptor [Mucilaginibacter sp.]|nr:TonB-dependent receptor [Mucilaginibacter sp.]
MKIIHPVLLTLLASLGLNFSIAQTPGAKITGLVQDADKKPVDGATVVLIRAADSVAVKKMLANTAGSFSFENIKDGAYKLKVTYIGYKNYSSEPVIINKQSVNLPAIKLIPASTALKEVAVTGQKSFVEQKIDRTVVNVGALISNTGTNALEVLEKTPGVIVDADGNITFKGKSGVLVLIDDKPTYLSAANLATYLRSLPSSSLDQIELMDNPPAKYDAAGNAGVINIKTKKSTIKGFNAILSANFDQGYYNRTMQSVNLNYRINKINLFANASYSYNRNFRRLEIDRNFNDANGNPTAFKDFSYFRPSNYNTNLKLGMDYYLSPKTTWGVVFTGNLFNSHDSSPVNSFLYNKNGGLDSTVNTLNTSKNKFNSGGINLNYSHQFDSTGKALTFDLDYIRDVSGSDQIFVNDTFLPDGTLKASQTLTDNLPGYINIYAAKTDFTMPLKGKAKFEAGIKSSYVNTDNAANYFNLVNNISTIDYNNTNRFLYRENINAAYVNFNKNFKRFSLQTGLRLENTNSNGHQLGNAIKADSSFTNHYTDLFPTAYFSYKLDTAGHHLLVLSYGRRIGRPTYSSLNPFTFFVDKFTYFSGNPFLRPQFTDNYKLAYSYKSLFTIALTYNRTTDFQSETIIQNNNIFISTTGNIGQRKNIDLSVNTNLHPVKWWTVNVYAEVYNNAYSGRLYSGSINQSGSSFSANANNQFTFSNGWSAELSGFYNSSGVYGQFISIPTGMLNAGLQKKVMQNKGSIRLSMRDILHSYTPSGQITNIAGTTSSYHNFIDTRVASLAFTYNLGKLINNPRKRDTGSADSEQGRAH